MSDWVRAAAPGKINLFFRVGAVRPDGYHDVVSVYQAIELSERVSVRQSSSEGGLLLEVLGSLPQQQLDQVPRTDGNLVVKAANRIFSISGLYDQNLDYEIVKQVPVAGGLAGGSADAAATMLAVNALLHTGFSRERLMVEAAELGADVPFSLMGGTALGKSRGEELSALQRNCELHLVVILNDGGLSTPAVYAEIDRQRELMEQPVHKDARDLIDALSAGDLDAVATNIHNDLEVAAIALMPELELTIAAAEKYGALRAFVSGSGPTVIALARDEDHAKHLQSELRAANFNAVTTKATDAGASLLDGDN